MRTPQHPHQPESAMVASVTKDGTITIASSRNPAAVVALSIEEADALWEALPGLLKTAEGRADA